MASSKIHIAPKQELPVIIGSREDMLYAGLTASLAVNLLLFVAWLVALS